SWLTRCRKKGKSVEQRIKQIGFIGVGTMGQPMAMNLLKKGFTVRVHDTRADAMKPLSDLGAIPTGSPREAAQGAEVVITMLPDTPHVEQVITGPDGVVEG